MNRYIEPKAAALAEDPDFAKAHHRALELVDRSLAIALAQYVFEIAHKGSDEGAENYWKIKGAHEFVRTLKNLVESADVPKQAADVNLSGNQRK